MATTAHGIVYPVVGDQVTPLANVFAALATSADTAIGTLETTVNNGANALRGLTAGRPVAGTKGRTYFATDTNILWFDNGAAWKNRTPGIFAQVTSSTGLINGTTSDLTWTNSVTALFVDTGGFFNSGAATRITVPYTGVYEVNVAIKSNGVAGLTGALYINGVAASAYFSVTGGPGVSGTAVTAARSFMLPATAADYLTFRVTSTATALGSHSLTIKYLGEV